MIHPMDPRDHKGKTTGKTRVSAVGREGDQPPDPSRPRRISAGSHQHPQGTSGAGRLAGRALILTLLLTGCSKPIPAGESEAVLAVSSRFGWAQACAIGPDLVITAAHVVDPDPKSLSTPLFPVRFEAEDGTVGILTPLVVDQVSDLALLRTSYPLTHWHKLATTLPERGDEVRWYGYDWRKRSNVAALRCFRGRVVRVKAGHLWIDEESTGGTSGSCVENAQGEIVGILSAGLTTDDEREAANAVVVGGIWAREVERLQSRIPPEGKP